MVMGNNLVITAFIVIAMIVSRVLRCSLFLVTSCPDEVYRLIVEDLFPLVGGKVLGFTTPQHGYKSIVRNLVDTLRGGKTHRRGRVEERAEVVRGNEGARPILPG
jgi:hypothetical protein